MTNGTQGSEVVCLRERSQAHVFEATEQQASCLEPSLDQKLAVVSSMDDDGRQGQPETAAEQHPRGFKDAKEQNNRGSNSAPWKRIMNKVRKSQKVSKEEPRDAVLLLFSMDACRFELLALQAISDTATVSDIFEHVSSCKEECLREQPYQGILSVHADTLITKDMNVAQCCDKKSSSSSNNKRNSILVAVPEGASVIECTRSAIQLLSDPVIIYNVRASLLTVCFWAFFFRLPTNVDIDMSLF